MKEGKECKDCEGHWHGGMHRGGSHIFITFGTLALIYGAVNYLRVTYVWPSYTGWVAGGLALIVLGVGKKFWSNKG